MVSSFCPHHRILKSLQPGFLPLLSYNISVGLAPPSAPQNCRSVVRMIPHEVEILVGLKPLIDSCKFSIVEPAVQVSRHVGINLYTVGHGGCCGCSSFSTTLYLTLAFVPSTEGWGRGQEQGQLPRAQGRKFAFEGAQMFRLVLNLKIRSAPGAIFAKYGFV